MNDIELSIVMPCLNEAETLEVWTRWTQRWLVTHKRSLRDVRVLEDSDEQLNISEEEALVKLLDRLFQRWRVRKIRPYLLPGDRVLDIGCSDGILFRSVSGIHGVGVDPTLPESSSIDGVELIKGSYPEAVPEGEEFDKLCMLAVFEHIPTNKQSEVATCCFHHLKPNGYLIITVPSPAVDRILDILTFLHLVEAGEFHQHYGFKPCKIPALFEDAGLRLVKASRFQLGLNNLFVFQKPDLA